MSLDITYELVISFENKPSLKEDVMNWLIGIGEESFVEGIVDGLDLDYDYENEDKNYYEDLGGSASSISLYKYDKEHLMALKEKLSSTFGENLNTPRPISAIHRLLPRELPTAQSSWNGPHKTVGLGG